MCTISKSAKEQMRAEVINHLKSMKTEILNAPEFFKKHPNLVNYFPRHKFKFSVKDNDGVVRDATFDLYLTNANVKGKKRIYATLPSKSRPRIYLSYLPREAFRKYSDKRFMTDHERIVTTRSNMWVITYENPATAFKTYSSLIRHIICSCKASSNNPPDLGRFDLCYDRRAWYKCFLALGKHYPIFGLPGNPPLTIVCSLLRAFDDN